MTSLRWYGRKDLRLEEHPLEGDLPSTMIEIDVVFCGICGSDLAEYAAGPKVIPTKPHPLSGHEPPVTLGHEFAGIVSAVGQEVTGIEIGQRVSADACWRCTTCWACTSGRYNLCAMGGAIGIVSDGAMAPRVRIPAYCAVPLADTVSLRAAALLEPYAVGLHALDRGAASAGQTVIVGGFGPIGVATAEMARSMGLQTLVIEPARGRRERAEALGHHIIEGSTRTDRSRAIRALTGDGADLAVDASGVAAALEDSFSYVRRGGTVVAAGVPREGLKLNGMKIVLKEQSLVGTLGYHNDLPRVAAMIAGGHIQPERAVTDQITLDEAPAAFARLTEDPGDDLKVLIEIGVE